MTSLLFMRRRRLIDCDYDDISEEIDDDCDDKKACCCY